MKKIAFILLLVVVFSGCVNTPQYFKSAGFQTKDEAKEYIHDYLYFAHKLSDEEWAAFYRRFPEYWKDREKARTLGSTLEFHPWYTAYAFKWTTNKRKNKWREETLKRLETGNLAEGDNIFKVVYARGVPGKILWDNDFEILLYKQDKALVFMEGVFNKERECLHCIRNGMGSTAILHTLKLTRPKY